MLGSNPFGSRCKHRRRLDEDLARTVAERLLEDIGESFAEVFGLDLYRDQEEEEEDDEDWSPEREEYGEDARVLISPKSDTAVVTEEI